MKRMVPLALVALALMSCAHDSYTVIPNGGGSNASAASDTKVCKNEVIRQYFEAHPHTGLFVGALAGGIVGGAIGATVDEASDGDKMQLSDMKPAIEACMRQKGYEANSDNEP